MPAVSTRWFAPPEPEALYVGRPARGSAIGTFADGLNHLAGWRFQRSVQQSVDTYDYALGGYAAYPLPSPDTHRVPLQVSGVGDPVSGWVYLWVAFTYYADFATYPGASVTAIVNDYIGGTPDAGCYWSVRDGHLQGNTLLNERGQPVQSASGDDLRTGVPLTAHTGFEVMPNLAPGPEPFTAHPRPLMIVPGSDIYVRFVTVGTAIMSISVFEMHRGVL